MITSIQRLLRDKRGAIAIIFGFSLIPMAMLVALSIDFSFYTQARAQITLAADAAATYAIRAATETYTAEINENPPLATSTAIADADAAGEAAGAAWFADQLSTLPTASVTGPNNPNVIVQSNTNLSATNPAGFTATVSYTGTYPPFFDPLFSSTSTWKITGSAGALSTYSYVEILMMLDNSGSMDIGATPKDIQTLEENTMCIPSSWINTGANSFSPTYDTNDQNSQPPITVNLANERNYNPSSGLCNPGYGYSSADQNNLPYSPCGFACHTNSNGQDYYGIARSLGVTLREDVVLSAAENVISSMKANEQAPDQFSVGVYQFNTDISPLFPTSSTQSSTTNSEASTDLSGALAAVDAIDYTKNPSAADPVLPGVLGACCETDFPASVNDLLAGHYSNDVPFGQPISAAGSGNTPNHPQKDIFIVTDGMEDAELSNGIRVSGEMTGIAAENNTNNFPYSAPVCKQFKKLGFTVYVLYIEYNPLPNYYYLGGYNNSPGTSYFDQDFPSVVDPSPQDFAEATSADFGGQPPPANAMSPDEAALQACASSPSDFYIANDSGAISTAMNAMLKSALSTTIRITQ
jgi:Flp pilus assembly protein TadG